MLGRELDEAQEWVRSWTAQVSARAQAATALSDRVAAITASAEDADDAVRVTVAASGLVTGLELDDRVRELTGAELARTILETIAGAQARLAEQVAAAVRDTVGTDSETGRAVIASYARRFPPLRPDDNAGDHAR